MQVLDRAGVGTLWSICKVKFALAGHTHSSITDGTMTVYSERNNEVNFGGSKKTDTICFGYRAKDSKPIPSIFVFGSDTGTATLIAAKFKGALEGNASTASNASSVNGHTVNSDVPSGAKFTDTNTWIGKFNSYKYIQKSTDGEEYHVVNIDYNFVLVGNKQNWPIEPDLPSFIISDNVEQVGEYKPVLDKDYWITKLYKIKDFNKTIYLDRSTYLYYKITEDGMKQCDSNGNILV